MTGWNENQQEVLDSAAKDENVLVSAAAGSGKTAVMVERIVNTIAEGKAGIDEILVVTFTKAAAAQMKAKIRKNIEERIEHSEMKDKKNAALLGQLSLLGNAEITTIDSFCNHVVKEHFNAIGIDPVFDMMDGSEAELLKDDILTKLFSDMYQEDGGFRKYVRLFSRKNHDTSELRKTVLKIARTSDSFASPAKWLERAERNANHENRLAGVAWLASYYEDCKATIIALKPIAQKFYQKVLELKNAENKEGIEYFADIILDDIEKIEEAVNKYPPSDPNSESKTSFKSVLTKKCTGISEELLKDLKDERSAYTKEVNKKVFSEPYIQGELVRGEGLVSFLIGLVTEYQRRLLAEKKKLKKYEFNDIAHFAYQILCDETSGMPTAIGEDYAKRFRYIYIDEYQDGNDLQEQILTSVARRNDAEFPYNVFIVGDVKQSIYKFRLARPQLFTEKARRYNKGESDTDQNGRLINLNKNYRSRKEILEATNFIFEGLMTEDFGGIPYDDDARLNYPHPIDENEPIVLPEILLINTEQEEDEQEGEQEENKKEGQSEEKQSGDKQQIITVEKDECEAVAIALKIEQLVNGFPDDGIEPFYIENEEFDKNLPESETNSRKRKAEYKDIMILQRGVKGSYKMVEVYERFGIPVVVDDPNGYFDAEEVMVMLSVLAVIDNRMQDIPMAAVLRSPIGGLSDSEMAWISLEKNKAERTTFCSVCDKYLEMHPIAGNESDDPIAVKLHRLYELLDKWKKDRRYLSIPGLLDEIYEDTGYDLFVTGMPEGKHRKANLDALRRKAESFSGNGNQAGNLFLFLRYMEKCRIHEVEFAEPGAVDSNENAVHIGSIHSSKGLEYPIVIVARMGKGFNMKDYSGMVHVSPDYYITPKHFSFHADDKYIAMEDNVIRKTITEIEKMGVLHEELRLLYVAMTRAKEKLILSGTVSKDTAKDGGTSYLARKKAKSYYDFIVAVLKERREEAEKYFIVDEYTAAELVGFLAMLTENAKMNRREKYEEIREIIEGKIKNNNAAKSRLDSCGSAEENPYVFRYKYSAETKMRAKKSVSDIKMEVKENTKKDKEEKKKARMAVDPDASETTEDDRRPENTVVSKGAQKGTLVHKVMELLPFTEIGSREEMEKCVKKIIKSDVFSRDDRILFDALTREKIYSFYSDDEKSLFQRMRKAAMAQRNGRKDGALFREQQFLTGIPVDAPILQKGATNSVEEKTDGQTRRNRLAGVKEDIVTVQGIVDAFFYETDENGEEYIVLVDYKTDRVSTKEELVLLYRAQMEIYAETIASISQVEVREIILYGFTNHIGEVRV